MPALPCLQSLQRELADSIIRWAHLDEIRILLACGAKVNEPVTQGLRPLHYASYQAHMEAVNLLLVRGADLDAMDDVGYTALHLAAERGYLDLVTLLVDQGARVKFTELKPDDKVYGNYNSHFGNPPRATLADEPLRLAVKNGHYEVSELLLKHGADPNARYFLGSEINLISPLNISFMELLLKSGAAPDSRDRAGLTPLMKAARHPQGYAAAKLLIGYGADVNAMTSDRHDYRSVLHYAVLSGNADMVRLLLSNGVSAKYPAGLQKPTPLDFAILRGNVEMVLLLINAGADVNSSGSPIIGLPLHIALSEKMNVANKMVLVKLLLDHGADPNGITLDERGPLLKPPIGEYINSAGRDEADNQIDPEVVRVLLKYGARILIKSQRQHPLGILKTMYRLDPAADEPVLRLVLDAAESYSAPAIKRCNLLGEKQRTYLMSAAGQPLPLKHHARLMIRCSLGGAGPELLKRIDRLPAPEFIKKYLLYEI